MAIYKSDIVDINLETCNIHRAFLNRTIGSGDSGADHFGIRVFRDGEPVDLTGVSVQGIFLPPQGSPIAITDGNSVSGNEAYVVLPQACYNYDGQFCLSIKLVGGGVTGTMRIVDGMVDNTHSTGTVAPTETVPTYQEILSTYDDMVAATAAANGAIAKPYAQLTFPVKKGDYTIVDGALKRALVDIATSETYTAAHWTDAKLGPDVSALKSAFKNNIAFVDSSYVRYDTGAVSGNYAATKASEYVFVTPGSVLNLSDYYDGAISIASIIGLAFYDSAKQFISDSGIHYDGSAISTIVPADAYYVRFTVYVGCIGTYILSVNDESDEPKLLINNEFVYSDNTQTVLQKNMNLMSNGVKSIEGIVFTTGKYVDSLGEEEEIAYASVTGLIKATNVIAVYAYLTTYLTISYYNINGRFLGYINDTTNNATTKGTPKLYTLNKPIGTEYIRISNVHTRFADNSVYLMVEKDIVYKDYTENVTAESGKYCNTINGTLSAVTYAEVSDFYQIDNIVKVYGSLSGSLGLCYYDFDKKFISGINGVTGEAPSWRTLSIPNGAYYLRMSNDTRYNASGIVFQRKATIDTLNVNQIYALYNRSQDSIANVSKNTDNVLAMYDRIICIGDSLTWSQVYTADEEQRKAFKPYPKVLGSMCGANADIYATPGDSAVLWWQRSSTGAFAEHGLYIIFLGTNGGLTDTIETDCIGTDPDEFDKTTNTGAYGAILQTITNNGDKAVLITPYAGGGSSISTTKSVINKFSIKYDFPVIDINTPERTTTEYHLFPDGIGQNTLHFNDLGYTWMANEVKRQINLLSAEDKFKIMRGN